MRTMTLKQYQETVMKLDELYQIRFDVRWNEIENELIVSGLGYSPQYLNEAEKILLLNGFRYSFRKVQEFDYISGRTYTTFKFKLEG